MHDLARQHREKAYIFKRTHHSQRAEQAGQRFQVKIPEVRRVRRNDAGGHDRTRSSDQQHRVLLAECTDLAQRVLWMCNKPRKRSLLNHNKILSPGKFSQREKLYYTVYAFVKRFSIKK